MGGTAHCRTDFQIRPVLGDGFGNPSYGCNHLVLARPAKLLLIALLLLTGCQQKMADQPSYKESTPCDFFADGRSERPAVPGTVARGYLRSDIALWTGRRVGKNGEPMGATTPTAVQPAPNSPEEAKARQHRYDDFVDTFPFPMTAATLEHGYQRYTIYCAICHDPLGTGQGKIVERGYTAPPSYHIKRLREAPVGHMFAVISEGYGSMPSYSAQIPLRDRWAIVGYIRALQTSQHFPQSELSDKMRRQWAEQDKAAAAGEPSP
jgi:mono/diheme cytochrome c family protein